jgi:GNAT superfamily N-acetyltransferase
MADLPRLKRLMSLAIGENLKAFLTPAEIEASHAVMGLDTTLIEDGTYFVVEIDGALAGCGGWSRRRTMYGGDHTHGRDAARLDPTKEPARVRAMYTHPDFTRRGVGRKILEMCEEAAAAEGFGELALVATLGGEPLYLSYGFTEIERFVDAGVPLVRMGKLISGP